MKALSLTQPWATLVALGAKQWETRSWSTAYRGDLYIHAAKSFPPDAKRFAETERALNRLPAQVPFGAVIARVRLTSILRVEQATPYISPLERLYGNYNPGRYAWKLEDVEPFLEPMLWRGALGLFNIPDDIIVKHLKGRCTPGCGRSSISVAGRGGTNYEQGQMLIC